MRGKEVLKNLKEGFLPLAHKSIDLTAQYILAPGHIDLNPDLIVTELHQGLALPGSHLQHMDFHGIWHTVEMDKLTDTVCEFLSLLQSKTREFTYFQALRRLALSFYRGIPGRSSMQHTLADLAAGYEIKLGNGPRYFNPSTGLCEFPQKLGTQYPTAHLRLRTISAQLS